MQPKRTSKEANTNGQSKRKVNTARSAFYLENPSSRYSTRVYSCPYLIVTASISDCVHSININVTPTEASEAITEQQYIDSFKKSSLNHLFYLLTVQSNRKNGELCFLGPYCADSGSK